MENTLAVFQKVKPGVPCQPSDFTFKYYKPKGIENMNVLSSTVHKSQKSGNNLNIYQPPNRKPKVVYPYNEIFTHKKKKNEVLIIATT